jgi:hypothetical protein
MMLSDKKFSLSQLAKAKINEKPQGATVNYDDLIQPGGEGCVK